MFDYEITVKPWMLKEATPDFDFMDKFNKGIPMPLMVMYTGGKVDETKKMIRVNLHGDIKQRITQRCMCCGQVLTNKVSQYFGIGPVCGGHNYTHPFDTEEELDKAVSQYRTKLVNTTWSGWIPYSAIISIDSITDPDEIRKIVDDMPIEIDDTPVFGMVDDTKPKSVNPNNVIRARIGKPVQATDDFSVFLSFKYNPRLSGIIKEETRVHIWDKDAKEWEIEYKEFAKLQALLPEIGYTFDITGEDLLPERVTVDDSYEFKTKPMSHQIAGIQYGLDHSRFLLADDQGCGKSKEVIDLALIRKQTSGFKHCLIVCGVNSLKWNWLEEIEKHSNETGWILGMKKMKRSNKWQVGSVADRMADVEKLGKDPELDSHYFIITNIETLRNEGIANKLAELCEQGIINMVACDEVHRIRNLKTQAGQGLLKLKPDYRVAMTGTPLINTPLDLYAILNWLGYQRYSFKSFKYHFCNFDEWGGVIGYKNIDQLKDQLDSIMIRRTKKEVLDLPEKVYVTDYVELTDEQRKLYNKVITDAIASEDTDDKECILVTKLKLRQVAGGIGDFSSIKVNPKLDRLEQIVEEAVYAGTKVIVYSNWIEGIKPAIERLQKYNPVVITGETNDSDRQAIVNKFQNDDSVKVIFGTTTAMGIGITLTAATEVVFLDNPWNNATKEQACDRAYRIGTKSNVTIHTIMAHGTYDEDVQDIIDGKKVLSENIVEKKDLAQLKI